MIIVKAPFRVSFAGGGSDLPSFYKKYGGCVVSTSIAKYMYIILHSSFDSQNITLKYSKTECCTNFDEIEHKYFREVLKFYNLKGVEIASIADIPSGTGLGSSSSFLGALIAAVKKFKSLPYTKSSLAQEVCEFEIDKLENPIGKQDQYASVFGGLNFIEFNKDGTVNVNPIKIPSRKIEQLEENLMLFYTGLKHDASVILKSQNKIIKCNKDKIECQIEMCNLAKTLRDELNKGNIDYLGECLDKNWNLKKQLSPVISNGVIDSYYDLAINNGAIGGKLLGAGGGGFLLFYVPKKDQEKVREALSDLKEISFSFDFDGVSVTNE